MVCIDYMTLNVVTIKEKFHIPIVDELLDEWLGPRYFLNWIRGLVTIKSECIIIISLKQPLGLIKGVMSS